MKTKNKTSHIKPPAKKEELETKPRLTKVYTNNMQITEFDDVTVLLKALA